MLTPHQAREAHERWLANPPAPATLTHVSALLKTQYHARPLSLDVIPPTIITNDEELRPEYVAAVFTITDAATLLRSAQAHHGSLETYLQHLENERAEAAEYFRATGEVPDNDWEFIEAPGTEIAPYDVINLQITLGQRINIVLEVEGSHVTSFKVSGSDPISDHLNALTGYPEPPEGTDKDGSIPYMKRGDLTDIMFVRYLNNAVKYGVL